MHNLSLNNRSMTRRHNPAPVSDLAPANIRLQLQHLLGQIQHSLILVGIKQDSISHRLFFQMRYSFRLGIDSPQVRRLILIDGNKQVIDCQIPRDKFLQACHQIQLSLAFMYPLIRKQDCCDGEVTLQTLHRLEPADLAPTTPCINIDFPASLLQRTSLSTSQIWVQHFWNPTIYPEIAGTPS